MKKWYYIAIGAGVVMYVMDFFSIELQESMFFVAGALICLGLGGVIGTVNPVGNLSAGVATTAEGNRQDLPTWRHWLANSLLLVGAILFIMSLFR